MGMRKPTRLTRKRSINNSLVALTKPLPGGAGVGPTAAKSPATRPDLPVLGVGGITRERISVGTHSPLGSPTEEMLPPLSPLAGGAFVSPSASTRLSVKG